MANIQKYGTYDPKAAEQEAEELARSTGEFFKPQVGTSVVRMLPPLLGRNSPFAITYQHAIELPGMSRMLTINCPRMMAKRPCPVCQEADKLRATGRPADYDLAGTFYAGLRVYCNIIDRANEDVGPIIWPLGKKVYEQLIGLRQDTQAGGHFTDPTEDGFDLVIRRVGTGKNDTKYQVNAARNSSPLGNMEWIEMQKDLTRFIRVASTDEIVKMLQDNNIGCSSGRAPQQARRPAAPARHTAESDAMDTDGVSGPWTDPPVSGQR